MSAQHPRLSASNLRAKRAQEHPRRNPIRSPVAKPDSRKASIPRSVGALSSSISLARQDAMPPASPVGPGSIDAEDRERLPHADQSEGQWRLAGHQETSLPSASVALSSVSGKQEQNLDDLADAFLAKLQSKGFSPGSSGIDANAAKALLTGFAAVASTNGGDSEPSRGGLDVESDWESDGEPETQCIPAAPTVKVGHSSTRRKTNGDPAQALDAEANRVPGITPLTQARGNVRVPAHAGAALGIGITSEHSTRSSSRDVSAKPRAPTSSGERATRLLAKDDIRASHLSETAKTVRGGNTALVASIDISDPDPLQQNTYTGESHYGPSAPTTEAYRVPSDAPSWSGLPDGKPFPDDVAEQLSTTINVSESQPPVVAEPPPWLVLHAVKCPDNRKPATFFDEPMLEKNDWDRQVDHRWHWDARNRVSPGRLRELRSTAEPFIVTREYDCSLIRRQGAHRYGYDSGSDDSGSVTSVDSSRYDRDRRLFKSQEHITRRRSRSRTIESTVRSRSQGSFSDTAEHRRRVPPLKTSRAGHSADAQDTVRESVYIVSRALRRVITQLLDRCSWLRAYNELADSRKHRLSAPYHFFFHFQDEMIQYGEEMSSAEIEGAVEYQLLIGYLSQQTRASHEQIQATFERKKVKAHMMPYLFKPGAVLVTTEDDQPVGRAQTSIINTYDDYALDEEQESDRTIEFSLKISHYSFDGQFRLRESDTTIDFHTGEGEAQNIRDLPIYPFKFAPNKTQLLLTSRGANFVKYCCKHYVTYSEREAQRTKRRTANRSHDEDLLENYQTQVRYMIDGEAFRMIHEDEGSRDQRSAEPVVDAEPENEDFLCQLPAFVNGFHMVNKKWVPLLVENVQPIVWNKAAFDSLAAPDDTKMLITALITNKIKSTESMDFVQGKGTGLIVLLHGGPGTGKTLTAESVAELAEKPLYRVSCGDIGTDARQVEDYLTSVFYLGRRWESVVLLDEADVFLEERSLDNLQRNALVSVFLRMIEYFDGILVLTSNRVGTFDEAFKSRIQLSLHYDNLDAGQREKIWKSFVARLEELNEDMETSIKDKVHELAAYEMNGRQIRNAITSARQVSRFKEEKVSFKTLKSVIEVGQRFESYLREVKGHSSDEWAREEGHR